MGNWYYPAVAAGIATVMALWPLVIAFLLGRQKPLWVRKFPVLVYIFMAHLTCITIGSLIIYCVMLYLVAFDAAWKDFGLIMFPGAYLLFFTMGVLLYNLSLLGHVLIGLTFSRGHYVAFIACLVGGCLFLFHFYVAPPQKTVLNYFLFRPLTFFYSNVVFSGQDVDYGYVNRLANAAIAGISFFISFFLCKPILEKKADA